jgi:hypothetical protein
MHLPLRGRLLGALFMKAQTQQKLRRYHLYIGMFLAPAILFFALSGALQTFRLQEEKGWGGTPPTWIVWLASVHKDDRLPQAKAAEADEHAKPTVKPAAPKAAQKPKPSALPFKIFAVLMSIGLMLSAVLGMVIALNNRATRRVSTIMLVAGVVVPILLLKI